MCVKSGLHSLMDTSINATALTSVWRKVVQKLSPKGMISSKGCNSYVLVCSHILSVPPSWFHYLARNKKSKKWNNHNLANYTFLSRGRALPGKLNGIDLSPLKSVGVLPLVSCQMRHHKPYDLNPDPRVSVWSWLKTCVLERHWEPSPWNPTLDRNDFFSSWN